MEYYTLKVNRPFWDSFISFRREWRGKYTMSDLARESGFNAPDVHKWMNNEQKGELSTRFIATCLKIFNVSLIEGFSIERVDCDDPIKYSPSKVHGQTEHSDPLKQNREKVSAVAHSPDHYRKKFNPQVRKHLHNVF